MASRFSGTVISATSANKQTDGFFFLAKSEDIEVWQCGPKFLISRYR